MLDKENIPKIKNAKTRFTRVLNICDRIKVCDATNGGCGTKQPKYTKDGLKILAEYNDTNLLDNGADRKGHLLPSKVLKIFKGISNIDCDLMGFNHSVSRPENMIIENLAVPPPPVRPSVVN